MEKKTGGSAKAIKDQGSSITEFDAELIRKAHKTNNLTGDELQRLRAMLDDERISAAFAVLTKLTDGILDTLNIDNALTSENIRAEVARLYVAYGDDDAPQLERHLIDHVIACYLRLWIAERDYSAIQKSQHTLTLGAYWEKRLTMLQGRYLRAVDMLARVRRVKLSNLQINIANDGGKQLNTLQTPQANEAEK